MLIEAPELSSHAVIRHGFFTRQGGVSEGFYASLNGGLGSGDDPARVAENRRRMMEQFAFPPEALVSL
jgi:polyphenol oxidase